MSREDFMQFAMAAGLSAASAETLFTITARAEPKQGGSFRIGISNGSTNARSGNLGQCLHRGLRLRFWRRSDTDEPAVLGRTVGS